MAESAVSLLLGKLGPLLQEEVVLLRGVREEVEYVRDELERMRAFLRAADAMEDSDPEIKVWVKQVREVAYDTEDVLDEFMLHIARDHGDGFHRLLRKISWTIKNLKARHRIASDIQGIKSRITNISQGHQRYCYKFNVPLQDSSTNHANSTWDARRGDAHLLEESELVGIEKPKKQLIKWLVEGEGGSGLKVISVAGMGGLGKSTLVKKVFDDAAVQKHFQNHAWIDVSQSFKIDELLKDMVRQLFEEMKLPPPQGMETMSSHRLKTTINTFLQQSRFVLVLDDVWHVDAWDAIKYALPNNNYGSRVMLTTRNAEVASATSTETQGYVYTLEPLSDEESWTLFSRKTFQEDSCPPHLEKISKDILRRCGGLPLAIAAVSAIMATKNKHRVDEWEIIDRSLGAELGGNDKLQNMKKILLLSFNDLPPYLKSCFLYLSVFPEDHLIERMRIVRLWMAEGCVEEVEGKTLEEVAESYLIELCNRSLIQVATTMNDGKIRLCRVHDLLREIILFKSKEQNFVVVSSEQKIRWPEKVRRLSVHNTLRNAQLNRNASRLHSLLMFGVVDLPPRCSLFRGGVRLLKVLDLRAAPLNTFPEEIVKQYHLRYLSLRGTNVKMLPNSIWKLQNLETLDLKQTYITELPIGILQLKKLRHLLVYRYNDIETFLTFNYIQAFKAPLGIGGLSSLQKLCYIKADQGNGIVGELGRLNELKRLAILNLRREDGKALCSSLEKMRRLRSFNVYAMDEDEIMDLQHMSCPPQFLQRLYLNGRLESVPDWISLLHSLVDIRLRFTRLKDDPLEFLQYLPNLLDIRLFQAYDGETLCFKAGGFQKVKVLWLDELKQLKQVIVEEGSMPNLEVFYIRHCDLLEKVPTVDYLSKLRFFNLYEMPDDYATRAYPDNWLLYREREREKEQDMDGSKNHQE